MLQTRLAKLTLPNSAEVSVIDRRFLSQFRMLGETRFAKLDPPIWLRQRGTGQSKKQEKQN